MNRYIITIVVSFSLFFRIFTPLRLYISGGLALSMVIPIVLLYAVGGLYKNPRFYTSCFVAAIPILLEYLGIEYFTGYLPHSIGLLFAIACMEYYLDSKDNLFAKYTLITTYFSFFLLAVISTPLLLQTPGLNRMVLEMKKEGYAWPIQAYYTIEYSNVHAIPVLVIPLFYLYQQIKSYFKKTIIIVALLVFYLTTILSNAGTPMFMLFFYLFFILLYNPKRTISANFIIISGVVLILFAIMGSGLFTSFLRSVQPYLEGTMQSGKIDQVVYYLETGNTYGDMEDRENLYSLSFNTFLSHPLTWELKLSNIGNHSYLLDHLAAMGLIVFFPFFSLLTYRFFRPLHLIGNGKPYYFMAYSAFILLAILKNFFVSTSAMFIVPIFIIYIEYLTKQAYYVNNSLFKKSI